MEELTIRPASVEDAQNMANVHVRAWQWAYRGLIPDESLDSLSVERRAHNWEGLIQDPNIPAPYLAYKGTNAVGFVHAHTSRDGDASGEIGEVTSIYLLPEYVGEGIGWQLWSTALDQLRKSHHTVVTVWVLDTNERGRGFYERAGLVPDGESKTHSIGNHPIQEVRYRGAL
ncbi:GNAT family N-acetyltransferase [Arthrobacter rhombi]|uniref:GNAT family N-acetyltransferase n=1 Tax=Arthrobacter rhombi TaxID=71253 RepID=UPI0015C59CB9|nr:GNAT family N-acetyltransferase [Arthrobacter rhombi]